jgi:hypothetical protein
MCWFALGVLRGTVGGEPCLCSCRACEAGCCVLVKQSVQMPGLLSLPGRPLLDVHIETLSLSCWNLAW